MTHQPKVSVVMSTFNGERYLSEAVESLLNQTFKDFELIIVNDGSTDSTATILREFEDERLVILHNSENQGIAPSQNKALAAARGEYIALQDCDDISLSRRLELQVDFLDRQPDISLIGSSAYMIDEAGETVDIWDQPANDMQAKWEFLFGCPIFHTTAMLRRSVFDRTAPYTKDCTFSCDSELFSRIADANKVFKLPQPLVKWRLHKNSTSFVRAEILRKEALSISRRNMTALVAGKANLDALSWRGVELLLMMNVGATIDLSRTQLRGAANFIFAVNDAFYERYGFTTEDAREHRRGFYSKLIRRFLALACRAGNGNRDLICRVASIGWAAKVSMRLCRL